MNGHSLLERLGRTTDWYDVCGPSQSTTILLVHGSTLTRHSWQPQIEALRSNFQIIAPDLPGHGALADFPFTFTDAIRVVELAVQASSTTSILLVGASLGGHVATLYANQHPEHVAGLVISGASMNFHGPVGVWTRLVGNLMPRLFSPAYLRRMGEQSIVKKWPADTVSALLQGGIYPAGAFQSFRELPDYDFKAIIKRLEVPILILNGEKDQPNRKQENEFLQAAPHAKLEIIDGAGHACAIEKPEAFNQALLNFAQQVFH